ncbi:MAG TPA: hypothetical protein VH682_03405 [Gemmataceae bacterium]|jgi:predicted nucleic-acid-binding Zn-ribbon protein
MPLDPSAIKKVEAWLEANCPDLTCPVCQSKTWDTGEIGILMPLRDGKITYSGPAIPLLPLVCKKCAYTHLFSAVLMGLLRPGSPPPTS